MLLDTALLLTLLAAAVSWTYCEVDVKQQPNADDRISNKTDDDGDGGDDGKIIGGELISIDYVPSLVSVQYAPFDDYFAHVCGGALIAPKYVLTAAHCVAYVTAPSQLRIRAGSTQQNEGGQTKPVRNCTIHPAYKAQTYLNDIAVLELAGRVWTNQPRTPLGRLISGLTSWLAPKAPRVAELSTTVDIPEDAMFYTAGWGATEAGGYAVDTLYGLVAPYINQTACRRMYSAAKISDSMLCAGYVQGGKDTCQGDSGGPLYYLGKVIGIVSWGEGCAKANKPGVYTRVTSFRTFIDGIVDYE